ncbi:MAG TPA: UDP-N-acetylmuramoyl-tripeptide--D-alanyl-D-alanine ligase [Clostridiales bacterium]|nr:UDP-N-acetylmuramoyl-tripeptide--D-alanyl-D-alanine ligase [Clostridiales bacterium]
MIRRNLKEIQQMVHGKGLVENLWDEVIIGVSIDTRKILPEQLFIPIKGETFDGHDFIDDAIRNGAKATLWNEGKPMPNIDIPFIVVSDTLLALQNLAREYVNQLQVKIIGITGSNGKTSTKDILYDILKMKYRTHKTSGNYNNELGVPLTVLSMDEETEIAVIEMGMSGLGEISLLCTIAKPDIAIITNSTDVHINDLGSVENILRAKMEIAEGLKESGLLIHYGDSELLKKAVEGLERKIIKQSFGEMEDNRYVVKLISTGDDGVYFRVMEEESNVYHLPMLGKHQMYNGTAAIAVARYLQISANEIQRAMFELSVTGMRNEIVHADGFDILNDTYKSNPTSMRAALETLYSLNHYTQKILILGDMYGTGDNEIQNHLRIGEEIDPFQVDYIFTLGFLGEYFAKGAAINFNQDKIITCRSKEELFNGLKQVIQKESIILVKGSRIVKLEEVVEKLLTLHIE